MNVAKVAVVFLLLALASPAMAATVVTVNENGVGTVAVDGGASTPLPFGIGLDPGGSGISTLFYTLPFTPSPGDLFILEGDTGNPSDVVRFNTNRLFFFSDNGHNTGSNPAEPSDPDLADNGVPTPPNPVFLLEGADEGNNGVVFSPTSTQPGFCATCGTGVTYNIISDQTPPQLVPELGSWLLMLGGMGALALNRVCRRGN